MAADFRWDVFISHASEDNRSFVEPLADELRKYGLEIWLDTLTLSVGDSLRRSIDEGLAKSRFGVVVLSPAFLRKQWPQHELDGLVALEMEGRKVILPVWHDLEKQDVLKFSPTLADKVAAKSSDGLMAVTRALIAVIRPEALTIQTGRKDVSLAILRLQEQLKQNAPKFEYRIVPADASAPTSSQYEVDPHKKLIGSALMEGLRIDVIAPDAAAYDANPLFAHATLTKAAVERLQEAHRTGDSVTLGPDEVTEIRSELFRIAGLPPSTTIESLTISPAKDFLDRRLPLRVTFLGDGVTETFSLIEFRFVRPARRPILSAYRLAGRRPRCSVGGIVGDRVRVRPRAAPDRFELPVGRNGAALSVNQGHAHRQGLHHSIQPVLLIYGLRVRSRQSGLGATLRGDVVKHNHHAIHVPRAAANRRSGVLDRSLAAAPGDERTVIGQRDDSVFAWPTLSGFVAVQHRKRDGPPARSKSCSLRGRKGLAISAAYVILGVVGHGTMRVFAGPSTADRLTRPLWRRA